MSGLCFQRGQGLLGSLGQELAERDVLVVVHVELHLIAQGDFSGDDLLAQRVLHRALDGPAKRTAPKLAS